MFVLRGRTGLVAFLLTYLLAGDLISGAVVYDNGPPDKANGSEMTHWIQADNFVLTKPTRLEGVKFWDFEVNGFFAGRIVWQIYADDGSGSPGTLLFSASSRNVSHTATGYAVFGSFYEYITTFDIGPISLAPGTYWVALHNGDLSNGLTGSTSDWNFYWEATGTPNGALSHKRVAPYDGPWGTRSIDLAFQLSGVAAPSLPAFTIDGGTAQISFESTAGYNYRVEYRNSLVNSSWTALPGADRVMGTGDVIQLTDSNIQTESRRFYRVTLLYDGVGAPVISSFGWADSRPQISFGTTANYFYRVEYKNELTDLSWAPVSGGETILGTGAIISFSDTDPNFATHPRRFYRVTLQ